MKVRMEVEIIFADPSSFSFFSFKYHYLNTAFTNMTAVGVQSQKQQPLQILLGKNFLEFHLSVLENNFPFFREVCVLVPVRLGDMK